jgi:hypothetical protein
MQLLLPDSVLKPDSSAWEELLLINWTVVQHFCSSALLG